MTSGERRKEPRYVVDAVNLVLGGHSFPVIDISVSSARISCTPRDYAKFAHEPVEIEFNRDGRSDIYAIQPRLIRMAELYIVLGFDPPRSDWDTYLRQFDTFHVHELDDQLFD